MAIQCGCPLFGTECARITIQLQPLKYAPARLWQVRSRTLDAPLRKTAPKDNLFPAHPPTLASSLVARADDSNVRSRRGLTRFGELLEKQLLNRECRDLLRYFAVSYLPESVWHPSVPPIIANIQTLR